MGFDACQIDAFDVIVVVVSNGAGRLRSGRLQQEEWLLLSQGIIE